MSAHGRCNLLTHSEARLIARRSSYSARPECFPSRWILQFNSTTRYPRFPRPQQFQDTIFSSIPPPRLPSLTSFKVLAALNGTLPPHVPFNRSTVYKIHSPSNSSPHSQPQPSSRLDFSSSVLSWPYTIHALSGLNLDQGYIPKFPLYLAPCTTDPPMHWYGQNTPSLGFLTVSAIGTTKEWAQSQLTTLSPNGMNSQLSACTILLPRYISCLLGICLRL